MDGTGCEQFMKTRCLSFVVCEKINTFYILQIMFLLKNDAKIKTKGEEQAIMDVLSPFA
ncbi:hypothetical protein B0I26_11274 [Anoxybacillus vitaminiphilus]|jgi:hypothetical protein|uniref:Uncharacterized protein n=1 Tax=Paranoxybacillus vitaminiphilus TaxID=581036 RepID=A0A327YB94_9BACL|nr:hypothetical protein [Anoxybacillus vitaminiphilus]RAK17352.1 hypothetical protein B0I26_11274 [Anoxybacillus vitaminiphilus]